MSAPANGASRTDYTRSGRGVEHVARFIALFVAVLTVSLTAGRAFWVWIGENPSHRSTTTFIESFQATNRVIAVPIAITGNLGFVSVLAAAALSWHDRPSLYFLGTAAPLLAASVLITLMINVPINDRIMTWNASSPPADWKQFRDRWWTWHVIRAAALLAALVLLLFGALLRRES